MTASKRCNRCEQVKPLTQFYRHSKMRDGYLNQCSSCMSAACKSWREQNKDVRAAYAEKHKDNTAKWQRNNPEKSAATIKLNNAVRDGKVFRWPTCALPNCNRKPQAHHSDYSRPLDVMWLCAAHHKQVHKEAREYLQETTC